MCALHPALGDPDAGLRGAGGYHQQVVAACNWSHFECTNWQADLYECSDFQTNPCAPSRAGRPRRGPARVGGVTTSNPTRLITRPGNAVTFRQIPDSWVQGSGFRVQGSGSRVPGSGFQGSGFSFQFSGFRVQSSEFRVQGSGFRVSGFKIQG